MGSGHSGTMMEPQSTVTKGDGEFYDRAFIVGELDGIVHFDMPA